MRMSCNARRRVVLTVRLFVVENGRRDPADTFGIGDRVDIRCRERSGLLKGYFDVLEVITWDEPLIHLPDRDAVRDYLIGRQTPAEIASDAARRANVPIRVTKRGAICFARR